MITGGFLSVGRVSCAQILMGGVRERERMNLSSRRCWSVWWRWLLSQQCFRWIVLQSASISDAPQGGETENERRATERTDGEDLGTRSWFRSFIRHFETISMQYTAVEFAFINIRACIYVCIAGHNSILPWLNYAIWLLMSSKTPYS